HRTILARSTGDVDYGPEAALEFAILVSQAWFDHWLRGQPASDEAPVRLFVMGINRWRDEEEWPLRRAVPTDFYLHSAGRANGLEGDGLLSQAPPEADAPDQFIY